MQRVVEITHFLGSYSTVKWLFTIAYIAILYIDFENKAWNVKWSVKYPVWSVHGVYICKIIPQACLLHADKNPKAVN